MSRHLLLTGSAAKSSLLTGLSAYWKLDEASGTRYDSTANHNDLTSTNGVGQAAGIVGNAASFVAASNQYLSVVPNAALRTTLNTGFTIAGWVYFNDSAAEYDPFSQWSTTTSWLIWRSAAGTLTFDANDGTNIDVAQVGAVPAAAWVFIAAWYDPSAGGTINLQVNNGTVSSMPHANGARPSTDPIFIGARSDALVNLNGRVNQVGFWTTRALTANELTYFYNGGNGRALL